MPHFIQSKTILNKTKRRDPWFLDDYTINPYSGCSFNCLYCYVRGSKYGEHMEEKLSIKQNAVELLEKQLALRAKKKQYGIIMLSSATDPYLQFERAQLLTRRILEMILYYRFPVHIITKSDLVIRDFDLLKQIDATAILPDDLQNKLSNKAIISFSFSTIDDFIAAIFEPGVTPPSLRMEALKAALQQGFNSGVNLMPLIPYITDTAEHLENMFQTFASLQVKYIFSATIALFGSEPSESKILMLRAIEKHYPHLLSKYHKFFAGSNTEMPKYYRDAFYRKTKDLSEKYGLVNSIVNLQS
ncbi:MAG TPA: radical SAM protein [Chitinophagaceae bacterium]|nr:radical SAM protein [Chitinophagaceae bacterium]